MKILMIGPGEPSVHNSGLGVAAHNIAFHLSQKVDLKVMDQNTTDINQKKSFDHVSKTLTDEELTKEISGVAHLSALPHYFYYEGALGAEDEEPALVQTSKIRKILNEYTSQIIDHTEKESFEVIYAHDWTSIPASIALKKKFNVPLVLHIHSLDYDRGSSTTNSWVFDIEKEGLDEADVVIAVSQYHATVIEEKYNIPKSKLRIVHHAVDIPKAFEKNSIFNEKLVVFVGRLTGQKGPEQFIKIAKLILNKNANTRFVMAGTGDLMKQLIESGINNELNGKFHITGQLSPDKLVELYKMADVYCMPSVSEPFGLTAIEAAAFGIPVVLSKQSGAAEVLPGALLADYWDSETMASQVLGLLQNEKLCAQISEQNIIELSKYSWENVADQIIEILNAKI